MAEAMRAAGRAITPFADLSRGVVGVRGRSADRQPAGQPEGRDRIARGHRAACSTTRSRRWPDRTITGARSRSGRRAADVRAVRRGPRLPAGLRALLGRVRVLRCSRWPPPAGLPRSARPPEPVRRRPGARRRPRPSTRSSRTKMFRDPRAGDHAHGIFWGFVAAHDRDRQHRDGRPRPGRARRSRSTASCGPLVSAMQNIVAVHRPVWRSPGRSSAAS